MEGMKEIIEGVSYILFWIGMFIGIFLLAVFLRTTVCRVADDEESIISGFDYFKTNYYYRQSSLWLLTFFILTILTGFDAYIGFNINGLNLLSLLEVVLTIFFLLLTLYARSRGTNFYSNRIEVRKLLFTDTIYIKDIKHIDLRYYTVRYRGSHRSRTVHYKQFFITMNNEKKVLVTIHRKNANMYIEKIFVKYAELMSIHENANLQIEVYNSKRNDGSRAKMQMITYTIAIIYLLAIFFI